MRVGLVQCFYRKREVPELDEKSRESCMPSPALLGMLHHLADVEWPWPAEYESMNITFMPPAPALTMCPENNTCNTCRAPYFYLTFSTSSLFLAMPMKV